MYGGGVLRHVQHLFTPTPITTHVAAYLLGGVTFLPLLVLLFLLFLFFHTLIFGPRWSTRASKKDTTAPIKPFALAKDETDGSEDGIDKSQFQKVGWLRFNREFKPQPSDTSNLGEMVMQGIQSYMQGKNGAVKRPKDAYFAVLKYNTLFLYESERKQVCKHVITLPLYNISIYPEGLQEFEVFQKFQSLRLRVKEEYLDDAMLDEKRRKNDWYIFSDKPIEKEDWFFALRRATFLESSSPGQPIIPQVTDRTHFDQIAINQLIQAIHADEHHFQTQWLNALTGRLFLSIYKTDLIKQLFTQKIVKKVRKIKRPSFLGEIIVRDVDVGQALPIVTHPRLIGLSPAGELTGDAEVTYNGGFRIEIETEFTWSYSQRMKPLKVNLVLAVTLRSLSGKAMIKIKPPPSNRIWYGFYEMPAMDWSIEPVVSDKQIKLFMVVNAIESRIRDMMRENIILPNMDDTPFFLTGGLGGIFGDISLSTDTEASDVHGNDEALAPTPDPNESASRRKLSERRDSGELLRVLPGKVTGKSRSNSMDSREDAITQERSTEFKKTSSDEPFDKAQRKKTSKKLAGTFSELYSDNHDRNAESPELFSMAPDLQTQFETTSRERTSRLSSVKSRKESLSKGDAQEEDKSNANLSQPRRWGNMMQIRRKETPVLSDKDSTSSEPTATAVKRTSLIGIAGNYLAQRRESREAKSAAQERRGKAEGTLATDTLDTPDSPELSVLPRVESKDLFDNSTPNVTNWATSKSTAAQSLKELADASGSTAPRRGRLFSRTNSATGSVTSRKDSEPVLTNQGPNGLTFRNHTSQTPSLSQTALPKSLSQYELLGSDPDESEILITHPISDSMKSDVTLPSSPDQSSAKSLPIGFIRSSYRALDDDDSGILFDHTPSSIYPPEESTDVSTGTDKDSIMGSITSMAATPPTAMARTQKTGPSTSVSTVSVNIPTNASVASDTHPSASVTIRRERAQSASFGTERQGIHKTRRLRRHTESSPFSLPKSLSVCGPPNHVSPFDISVSDVASSKSDLINP